MQSAKITRHDIDEIKRQHIMRTLLYTPQEVSRVLSISVRTVFNLLEEGRLCRARPGNRTTRITAESVEVYRKSIIDK